MPSLAIRCSLTRACVRACVRTVEDASPVAPTKKDSRCHSAGFSRHPSLSFRFGRAPRLEFSGSFKDSPGMSGEVIISSTKVSIKVQTQPLKGRHNRSPFLATPTRPPCSEKFTARTIDNEKTKRSDDERTKSSQSRVSARCSLFRTHERRRGREEGRSVHHCCADSEKP